MKVDAKFKPGDFLVHHTGTGDIIQILEIEPFYKMYKYKDNEKTYTSGFKFIETCYKPIKTNCPDSKCNFAN
jgi:hypothetical protein